LFDMQTEI